VGHRVAYFADSIVSNGNQQVLNKFENPDRVAWLDQGIDEQSMIN
jgi:hypothetical protein